MSRITIGGPARAAALRDELLDMAWRDRAAWVYKLETLEDSLARAAHFRRHAEAGMVMVNLPTAGIEPHVPFGGRKTSSHGPREQGRHAVEFYTSMKTAYVQAAA